MRWYGQAFGQDFELNPALPQVKEAAQDLMWMLMEWTRPPFWTADADPTPLHPSRYEKWRSRGGHCDGRSEPDVMTQITGRIPFRLAKGFHLLHASER